MKIVVATHMSTSNYRNLFSTNWDSTDASSRELKINKDKFSDTWMSKAVRNKREYCDRHNYILVCKKYEKMPTERNITWHKIQNILEIMEDTSVSWVFQSDLDSLFMEDSQKLENFIEIAETFGKKAIFANQGTGAVSKAKTGKLATVKSMLCAGHFFIKNCKWSRKLLKSIWDFPYSSEKHLPLLHDKYHEQCCLNLFLSENLLCLKDNSILMDNRHFNSFMPGWSEYTEYQKGDFIIHFGGLNFEQRNALVDEYLHRKMSPDESTWSDIPFKEIIGGKTYDDVLSEMFEKERMDKIRQQVRQNTKDLKAAGFIQSGTSEDNKEDDASTRKKTKK